MTPEQHQTFWEYERAFWLEKLQGWQALDCAENSTLYQPLIDAIAGSAPIAQSIVTQAWQLADKARYEEWPELCQFFGHLAIYLQDRHNGGRVIA